MNTVLSAPLAEFENEAQEASYNAWLQAKVEASLNDPRPNIPHTAVIEKARAMLAAKGKRRVSN